MNAFTHYRRSKSSIANFRGDADLPPRIIMLDGSGTISFDVLTWLYEQKVPRVKIVWTWSGNSHQRR
jgi:CRISPR-associated protein Cas1